MLSLFVSLAVIALPLIAQKWNVIDVTPSCYEKRSLNGDGRSFCPYGVPGGRFSIHPNRYEREHYLTRGMARFHPYQYNASKYGEKYGTWGSPIQYSRTTWKNCANDTMTQPLWWQSEANQVGRFNSWAHDRCIKGYAISTHFTCYDYCGMFQGEGVSEMGACSYLARSAYFLGTDGNNGQLGPEGIWALNGGFESYGHCLPWFSPKYYYVGLGIFVGSNAMTNLYNTVTDTSPRLDYPFVIGTHIDLRNRVPNIYVDQSKPIAFVVQWFGNARDPGLTASTVYLLYNQNSKTAMTRTMYDSSKLPNSAFYEVVLPDPQGCRPYAFLTTDQNGRVWRLPEDPNYFYVTYVAPDSEDSPITECEENHIWFNGNDWVPNASPEYRNYGATCQSCWYATALNSQYNSMLASYPAPVPTAAPLPVTVYPTISPTNGETCEDAQCVTLAGLNVVSTSSAGTVDARIFNGEWSAKPGHCIRPDQQGGLSYYRQNGLSGYFLCYASWPSRWIITTVLCDWDYVVAYCDIYWWNIRDGCSNRAWKVRVQEPNPSNSNEMINVNYDTSTVTASAGAVTCASAPTRVNPDSVWLSGINSNTALNGQWLAMPRSYNGDKQYEFGAYHMMFMSNPDVDGSLMWAVHDTTSITLGFIAYCVQEYIEDCDNKFIVINANDLSETVQSSAQLYAGSQCDASDCWTISNLMYDFDGNRYDGVTWNGVGGCLNGKPFYEADAGSVTEIIPLTATEQCSHAGDKVCFTLSGLPIVDGVDFNGNWRASGDWCSRYMYTYKKDDLADVWLCCTNSNKWVITRERCRDEPGTRIATCTVSSMGISERCTGGNYWVFDDIPGRTYSLGLVKSATECPYSTVTRAPFEGKKFLCWDGAYSWLISPSIDECVPQGSSGTLSYCATWSGLLSYCTNNWWVRAGYRGRKFDGSVAMGACSGALTICGDDTFPDSVCVMWDDMEWTFVTENNMCDEDRPVYRYDVYNNSWVNDTVYIQSTVYYLHYSEDDEWIISVNTDSEFGDEYDTIVSCAEDDLLDCGSGKWSGDAVTVAVNQNGCGFASEAEAEEKVSGAVVIAIVLAAVFAIMIVAAVIWFFKCRQGQRGKFKERVHDEVELEEDEVEVEDTVLVEARGDETTS